MIRHKKTTTGKGRFEYAPNTSFICGVASLHWSRSYARTLNGVCVCMCPILGNAADCGLLILSRGCDGALDERKKGHKLALGIVSSSSLYTSPSPSPPMDGSFFLPKSEPNLTVPDWNTDDEVRTRLFRLDPETVSLLHSRVYV